MKRLILLALSSLFINIGAQAQNTVPNTTFQIKLSFAPVVKKTIPAVVNIYAKRVVEAQQNAFAHDPFFQISLRILASRRSGCRTRWGPVSFCHQMVSLCQISM